MTKARDSAEAGLDSAQKKAEEQTRRLLAAEEHTRRLFAAEEQLEIAKE